MQRPIRQRGFTLIEVLLVVMMIAVVAALSFPMIAKTMERAQSAGAGQALAAAIRDARARAVASGFQYRLVAYTTAGTVPNAYRIEGMDPTQGGVWPAAGTVNTPPFYGTNQIYEAYANVSKDSNTAQIQIPAGGTSFTVTFNSSGLWAANCVPLTCQVQVNSQGGLTNITVSQNGAVQVVKQ